MEVLGNLWESDENGDGNLAHVQQRGAGKAHEMFTNLLSFTTCAGARYIQTGGQLLLFTCEMAPIYE